MRGRSGGRTALGLPLSSLNLKLKGVTRKATLHTMVQHDRR